MTSQPSHSEPTFRWIVDALQDGVYAINPDGVLVYVNRAFAEMLGFERPEELVGRPVMEFYAAPDDRDRLLRAIETKVRGSVAHEPYYMRAARRDGTTIHVHVASTRAEGVIEGRVTVVRRMTQKEVRSVLGGPLVFISYSHKDSDFVNRLAKDLDREGLAVWIDKRAIDVGESIPASIEKAIASCDFLVAVLTPSALDSRWFREELDAAHVKELESHGTVILPVLKEDCSIPGLLRSKKYADFRGGYRDGLKDLVASIGHLQARNMPDASE